jgi:hypothetical protein
MPIAFELEQLRKHHNCKHYFETGLWDPIQLDISSWKAVESNFDTVHCIELRQDFVTKGNVLFKEYIDDGKYFLYNDDSVNMKKYLDMHPFFNTDKTVFFLDAHVDNSNIKDFTKKCPLLEELTAIKSLSFNEHVILIDDLRILKNKFPWNEQSYGDINFLETIQEIILSINPNYQFATLNGVIENDVLCAYII